MLWLIIAFFGIAAVSVFTGFLGKIEHFSGVSKLLYYLFIAIMILVVILSVVAWYTQSFEPRTNPKQNSMLITCDKHTHLIIYKIESK